MIPCKSYLHWKKKKCRSAVPQLEEMWLTSLCGTQQLLVRLNSDLETIHLSLHILPSQASYPAHLANSFSHSWLIRATGELHTNTHFCISLISPGRTISDHSAPAGVGTTLAKSCQVPCNPQSCVKQLEACTGMTAPSD